MSFLTDIGSSLVTSLTGVDPAALQAEVTAGEQKLELAIQTQIALTAVIAIELFVLMVMAWKGRHV